MKKLVGLAVLSITMSMTFVACAQNKVPQNVKTALQQKFPEAQNISWVKEGGREWEAEFKMNGTDYSANFDTSGNWKETEKEIEQAAMPPEVKNALEQNYPNASVKEVFKIEKSEGIFYEFEIQNNGEGTEVVMDSQGNIQKKIEDEEDEAEDED